MRFLKHNGNCRILKRYRSVGQELFGTGWQGESSNWPQLQEIVQYLSGLHESVANSELPEALVKYLASTPDLDTLGALVATVEEHQNSHPASPSGCRRKDSI